MPVSATSLGDLKLETVDTDIDQNTILSHLLTRREIMLVLTRKPEERIVIGGEIEVKVIAVRGNRVRLGIDCPDHISILRSELVPRIRPHSDPNPPPETVVP